MKVQTFCIPVATAALLLATSAFAGTPMTPEKEYDDTAERAAEESVGITIPGHTQEETDKIAASFEQRARTLGQKLNRTSDQVDTDIDGRRHGLVTTLHSNDAARAQTFQVMLTRMTQMCPAWLVMDMMHSAGLMR